MLDRMDIHIESRVWMLNEVGDNLVRAAMSQLNLLVRGYYQVFKLARTIAGTEVDGGVKIFL